MHLNSDLFSSLKVVSFLYVLKQKYGFSSLENNYGAPLPVKDNKRTSQNLPIFWEFVQFVIDSKQPAMDEHWKPAIHYCSFCMINYDFVIKFENLNFESQAFLQKIQLNHYIYDENVWNRHVNTNKPEEMSRYNSKKMYFLISNIEKYFLSWGIDLPK